MSHSFPLHGWATRELAAHDGPAWAEAVDARIRAGDRVVTAFGRPDGAEVLVTAVLQGPTGALNALRGRVDRAPGYRALTAAHPAMHAFERLLRT